MGSVEVVLVRDALGEHLGVHHAPARLRATPEQRLWGAGAGGRSGLPPTSTPPTWPPQPAYLCLHHRGTLGAQRVADGDGVGQDSTLVALAVAAPGAQGHI